MGDFGYNLDLIACELHARAHDHMHNEIGGQLSHIEVDNTHLSDLRDLQARLAEAKRQNKKIHCREDVEFERLLQRVYHLNPKAFTALKYGEIDVDQIDEVGAACEEAKKVVQIVEEIKVDQIEGLQTASDNTVKSFETRHHLNMARLTHYYNQLRIFTEAGYNLLRLRQEETRTFNNNQTSR